MAKLQVSKTRASGKKMMRGSRQTALATRPIEPDEGPAFDAMEVAADWRFHLATITRISDNLVTRAVNAYDSVFGLDRRDQEEIYFEVGKKLIEEEKIDEAIATLRKVLRIQPDHKEALFTLGTLHARRGAPVAASAMLLRAKAAGYADRKLHVLLADAMCKGEKFVEALAELDAAVALKPEIADTHHRRGVLLDKLSRHEEAVSAFEQAIKLAPKEIKYYQHLGFSLESLGRRADAIQCFKRALEVERVQKKTVANDEA
jgi:Flp pilus assembly protein TadD